MPFSWDWGSGVNVRFLKTRQLRPIHESFRTPSHTLSTVPFDQLSKFEGFTNITVTQVKASDVLGTLATSHVKGIVADASSVGDPLTIGWSDATKVSGFTNITATGVAYADLVAAKAIAGVNFSEILDTSSRIGQHLNAMQGDEKITNILSSQPSAPIYETIGNILKGASKVSADNLVVLFIWPGEKYSYPFHNL